MRVKAMVVRGNSYVTKDASSRGFGPPSLGPLIARLGKPPGKLANEESEPDFGHGFAREPRGA